MKARASALALSVVLALGALSSSAIAGDDKAAQAAFVTAQKKYDHKDYAGALPLFQKALDTSGSPNARLYVARSLREVGRLTDAWREFHITVEEATDRAKQEARFAKTRDAATTELAALEQRVGRVVVQVDSPPSDVEVKVNDEVLVPSRFGEMFAVEPGAVSVSATAPGKRPFKKSADVAGGAKIEIAVSFEGAAPVADTPSSLETPPEPPAAAPPPEKHGGGVRTAGFVVTGVGVVGMVVFAVTGSIAKSKFNQVQSDCGGGRCTDPKDDAVIDQGKSMTTVANIGLVGGIACLGAGALMIALGGAKQDAAAEPKSDAGRITRGLSFGFTPSSAGVGYHGSF